GCQPPTPWTGPWAWSSASSASPSRRCTRWSACAAGRRWWWAGPGRSTSGSSRSTSPNDPSSATEGRPLRRFVLRHSAQLPLQLLILTQVRAHEALPQLPVVGGMGVEQFVGDDVVLEFLPERQE